MPSAVVGPVDELARGAPHWSEGGRGGAAAGAADEIERFVRELVLRLEPEPAAPGPPGPGRPRVPPARALRAGLLVGVLRGYGSQQALWRLLRVEGRWAYPRFPVGDEAVRTRLAEGGPEAMATLFRQLSAVLVARLAPDADPTLAPFATEVVACDASALDPLARRLPALRGAAPDDAARLPGKRAGRFDLRRQRWQHLVPVADAREDDKVAARELLDGLPPGSLVLADLGYFGFQWFDDLTDRRYWYVSRLRAKTSYAVLHTCYQRGETFDGVVWLGAYRADRAKHAVRLVPFRQGGVRYRYITNVLDPAVLPMYESARLYARRWDFALAVKLVKRHLGLHLFWSARPVVVQQQVWATRCLAQILHALQLEVAGRAGVDPFAVSLALLVAYCPRLARAGQDPRQVFVARGRAAGLIRPAPRSRVQAPAIPAAALTPLPPGLALTRVPRYAQRHCAPRAPAARGAAQASVHQ
jgi:hypothetical protein